MPWFLQGFLLHNLLCNPLFSPICVTRMFIYVYLNSSSIAQISQLFTHLLSGPLALSVKSWPHNCEAGIRSLSGCFLSKEPSTELMLLLPTVTQKMRLRYVLLHAVPRCYIVFTCQCLTMPRLWFMCRDCARLSAINKACKLGGKPPYARRHICYHHLFYVNEYCILLIS